MAELVDALVSNTSGRKAVPVRPRLGVRGKGVSSGNADNANFLDTRQAECVMPFIYFGKQAGSQALKGLGDLYVNTNKKIAVGVNGVLIKGIKFDRKKVFLEVDNALSEKYLREAWPKEFSIILKIDGDLECIHINGEQLMTVSGNQIFW